MASITHGIITAMCQALAITGLCLAWNALYVCLISFVVMFLHAPGICYLESMLHTWTPKLVTDHMEAGTAQVSSVLTSSVRLQGQAISDS